MTSNARSDNDVGVRKKHGTLRFAPNMRDRQDVNPSKGGPQAIPAQAALEPPRDDNPGQTLCTMHLPVVSLQHDGMATIRRHIDLRSPMIITDLTATSPALQRWSPEYLISRYGHKIVRVYDASFGAPGKKYMGSIDSMPFADFLRETLGGGRDLRMFLYNVGRQIPELLDDLDFPDLGLHFSRRFVYTFFGCKGSTTPLHYDIDMGHVLHTAMHGRRRVRLFAPDQSRALYQHPFTVRSYVNLDQPDLERHPALACARGYQVVLEAGQTLFMPSGYWHEFHYLDAGFGLSLRAGSSRLSDRAAGLANLLALSPIDRLNNRLAPKTWFAWKQRQANLRATAYMNNQGQL